MGRGSGEAGLLNIDGVRRLTAGSKGEGAAFATVPEMVDSQDISLKA